MKGRIIFGALVCVAVGVGGTLAFGEFLEGDEAVSPIPPVTPYPKSALHIASLGDSFISGEGATRFFPETNNADNGCRRTWTAYSYQVAFQLQADLDFVACSGAVIDDLLSKPQYARSPKGVNGGRAQLDVIRDEADELDVILLSIGGNDAGFGEIVKECVTPGKASCEAKRGPWLKRIDVVEEQLSKAYKKLKETVPEADIFVLTYPNPLGKDSCTAARLNPAEHAFLHNEFIPKLNAAIMRAAKAQGLDVIDLSDNFAPLRLCEVPPDRSALNTFEVPFHNSYHPNEIGHTLIAREVINQLKAHGYTLPPADDVIVTSVAASTDETVPGGPDTAFTPTTTIPPQPPPPISFPTRPPPTVPPPTVSIPPPNTGPPTTDPGEVIGGGPSSCDTSGGISVEVPLDPTDPSIRVTEAAPTSPVCWRIDGGEWTLTDASATGRFELPLTGLQPSTVEVLFVGGNGELNRLVVRRN